MPARTTPLVLAAGSARELDRPLLSHDAEFRAPLNLSELAMSLNRLADRRIPLEAAAAFAPV